MTIEYELTTQDFMDFNLYHYHHSASMKRNLLITRTAIPVLFLLVVLLQSHGSKDPDWYGITMAIVFSILWIVLYPKYLDRAIRRNLTKMMKEGKSEGLLGHRELSVTPESIVSKTITGEARSNIIEKIDETDRYLFIYINAVSAHVIPKSVFKSAQDQREFLGIASSIPKL